MPAVSSLWRSPDNTSADRVRTVARITATQTALPQALKVQYRHRALPSSEESSQWSGTGGGDSQSYRSDPVRDCGRGPAVDLAPRSGDRDRTGRPPRIYSRDRGLTA